MAGTPARCQPWSKAFRTPDGTAYVDVHFGGHRETWAVRSPGFRHYLGRQLFEQARVAPRPTTLRQLIDQAEAEALFGGAERQVFLRVANREGRIYIDLADDQWQVVEVTPDGWRVINDPPVRFRRTSGMLALPTPQNGGSVEELGNFLNVQSRDDIILVVSWLLAALRGVGPYPVLAIGGEHGSAKSTLVEMLQKLIDPHVEPHRSLPRTEYDLFVGADSNFLQGFDNISALPAAISDALCRLATGGAFATRRFFKNRGEVVLRAMRPVMVNGISNVISRADLADRTISIILQPITNGRRTKEEISAAFETARPGIFGALLDALGRGLRQLPNVEETELARMADFDLWEGPANPDSGQRVAFRGHMPPTGGRR